MDSALRNTTGITSSPPSANNENVTRRRSKSNRFRVSYWQVTSVISCFFVNFFNSGVVNCYGVLYTYMQGPLGLTEYHMSWIGSLVTGLQGIVAVLAPFLIESIGSRMTTLLGPVLVTTGFICGSMTSNIYVLYFTLGVLPGIGLGLSYMAIMVYTNGQFRKWRPIAIGLSMCGVSIGILVMAPLTSGIADIMGWQGTLLIHGAIFLHLIPCALLIKPDSQKSHHEEKPSVDSTHTSVKRRITMYLQIFISPKALIMSLVHLFRGLSSYTFANFIPVFVIATNPEMTKTDVALIISLAGFANLAGRVLFSGVSMLHTKAPQYLFTLFLCLCGIAYIIVPLCEDKVAFLASGMLFGLAFGGYTVMVPLVTTNMFGIENMSRLFGVSQFSLGIGSLSGPPLESYIATSFNNQDLIFYTAGVFSITGGALVLPLLATRRPQFRSQTTYVVSDTGYSNEGFTSREVAQASFSENAAYEKRSRERITVETINGVCREE